MELMDYLGVLGPAFLVRSPMLVAWIVGIVLAARMRKRGGGKAERLLLIGCCLMLAQQLASPCPQVLILWLIAERIGTTAASIGWATTMVAIPLGIIGLAGIICLVCAFWIKFRTSLRSDSELKGGG